MSSEKNSPSTSTSLSAAPAEAHARMHADHSQWASECAFWHDEIALWQEALRQALAASPPYRKDGEALQRDTQVHAAAVRLRQDQLARHEHALAEFEQGGPGEPLIALAKAHEEEATAHTRLRAAHRDIKERVETALACWKNK